MMQLHALHLSNQLTTKLSHTCWMQSAGQLSATQALSGTLVIQEHTEDSWSSLPEQASCTSMYESMTAQDDAICSSSALKVHRARAVMVAMSAAATPTTRCEACMSFRD